MSYLITYNGWSAIKPNQTKLNQETENFALESYIQ